MKTSLGAKTIVLTNPVWVVGTYNQEGKPNVMTAAWGGICCSQPPCIYVSLRKATSTYSNIIARKSFTVSIPSETYVKETDYFGIASGKKVDKFSVTGLTPVKSDLVDAPYVKEFPLIIECKVNQVVEIGLHTEFIGEIVDVKSTSRPSGQHRKEGDCLNPFRFEMANIREQNSWVHMHDWEGSTDKAKDALRIAVAGSCTPPGSLPKTVPVEKAAMVVGCRARRACRQPLTLQRQGSRPTLSSRYQYRRAHVPRLDKTFPTLDCSQCILTPKMVDVGRAKLIELMTWSEVDAVEGYIGNFDVTIRKKARGVISMEEGEARGIVGGGCNGCGQIHFCRLFPPFLIPKFYLQQSFHRGYFLDYSREE